MKERLKKNICNLDDHSVLSEIKDLSTLKATHIDDALKYACCFWTNHLARIPSSSDGVEEIYTVIDNFFATGFLCWIEILILIGSLDIGVYALNDIEQWYLLVSHVQGFYLNLCLYLFRREFPANGQVMAGNSFWIILI